MQQVARMGSFDPSLPPQNSPDIPISKNIFWVCLDPFVQLLTVVKKVLFTVTWYVAHYVYRSVWAAAIVFSRILRQPLFDPHSPSFLEMLNGFETRVPILEKKIFHLSNRFWQECYIVHDLQELQKLDLTICMVAEQLSYYLGILEKRSDLSPILEQLTRIQQTYQELDQALTQYCLKENHAILMRFQNVVQFFVQEGIVLPDDICKELIISWECLVDILRKRIGYPQCPAEVSAAITDIDNRLAGIGTDSSKAGLIQPLKLHNIGNSCYLDSVLQMFLCLPRICDEISQPISREGLTDEEYRKKLNIQRELLRLVQAKNAKQDLKSQTYFELILQLAHQPLSQYALRQAIFNSGFHFELNPRDLKNQLDAASVMEVLIDHFLPNCKFKWQEHTSTDEFPGLEFIQRKLVDLTSLQIPLRQKTENQALFNQIQYVLHKHYEREENLSYQREFDICNDAYEVKISNQTEAEAAKSLALPAKKVSKYVQWYRLHAMPAVLALHFKRFKRTLTGTIKDCHPVFLPEDGMLDLTSYYDAPEGAPKQARYQIKSYVVHEGNLDFGHYYACVELSGKYYKCDDLLSEAYYEITREEFFGCQDVYLVLLERLPEELHP